jgi:uncharacterized protein YjbJ (UPF0337 family)
MGSPEAGGRNQPRSYAITFNTLTIGRSTIMSTNRIEGAARKAAGAIKEAAGKITGNDGLEVEGAAEKVAGDVQNKLGKAQDKLADELKK